MRPNPAMPRRGPRFEQVCFDLVRRVAIVDLGAEELLKPGEQGFMAALVKPGLRAVAISISAENAVAGFIMPNDRIDVLLTRKVPVGSGGGTEEARSDIILQNVGGTIPTSTRAEQVP